MENKTNIAEILKDCPKGMELDCLLYDNVTFERFDVEQNRCYFKAGPADTFWTTCYGKINGSPFSKCVIYPKGKTTWEGFIPPCNFKDGDIVATTNGLWIGITTGGKSGESIPTYCVTTGTGGFEAYFNYREKWKFQRLATTWEKEKLFQAIKDNGYKWNEKTKTLEKSVEPKFKVGDRIRSVISSSYYTVVDIKKDQYFIKSDTEKYPYQVPFNHEINYELVPNKFDIASLKPFESRVLVRHNKDNKWCGSFFSHIDGNFHSHCYKYVTVAGKSYPMCIPYEGNEHLLGTANDCKEYYKTW